MGAGHGNLLNELHDTDEELVFSGLHPFSAAELVSKQIQTTIERIEQQTGLNFGNLKTFDSSAGLESTMQTRPLLTAQDIII